MTAAILPPGAQLQLTLPPIDQTPEALNDVWRRSHYHNVSVAMNPYWPQTHGPAVAGVHGTDLRMFHGESEYDTPFPHDASSMISPAMGYLPDTNFSSDMDVGTPSTSGFPDITLDGYHHLRTGNQHLHPSSSYERAPSAHSPQSSISGVSPREAFARLADVAVENKRPNFARSTTAPAGPEQLRRSRKAATASSTTPSIRRSGSEENDDDDHDDEYVPSEGGNGQSTRQTRGRKRQRIPHTAVERRYRENLNAHLDKLRRTVPGLASAGGKKEGEGGGVKPSKCEVLNGAIEHICSLARENVALRGEVDALRARLDEVERFLQGQGR